MDEEVSRFLGDRGVHRGVKRGLNIKVGEELVRFYILFVNLFIIKAPTEWMKDDLYQS